MTDSDKTKGGNMVIDEIGLRLIEELCEGSWSEYKTKLLQERVFSNSEYKLKLREELVKILKNCKEDDQEETLNGFQVFLCGSSKLKTLKEYMSHGRSLIEAMSDLFQTEYLPDVLLGTKNVTVSVLQPDGAADQNSNTSLDVIIADPDEYNRMQRLIDLVPRSEMETIVRTNWQMNPNEETDPIIKHYCYHLAMSNSKWLKDVRSKIKDDLQLKDVIIQDFEAVYVNEMKGMKHFDKRDAFFGLIADTSRRYNTLWKNKKNVYIEKINEEIKKVFKHLLFPHRIKFTKNGLECTNEQAKNEILTLISKEKIHLYCNLKGFLTGTNGERLILKYFQHSNSSIDNWVHYMAINYIVSKPRIDHILADPILIKHYLSNYQEFYQNISILCRKFHFEYGKMCVLQEDKNDASKDNTNNERSVELEPLEFVSDITDYLWEKVDNGQRRCQKELGVFRFESKLSTFMYRICKNFLINKKKEIAEIFGIKEVDFAEAMEKGFVAENNGLVFNPQRFIELYRNYIRDLKNKVVKPVEIIRKTRGDNNNSSAERLVSYLNRTEMPIELAKAKVTKNNYLRDFDLLVDSVLKDYAWCFFGIRNREIQIAYDKMRASVINDIHNNKWPFMNRIKEDNYSSEIIVWPFWEIQTRINLNDLDDIYIQSKLEKFGNRIESIIKDCDSYIKKRDSHKDEEDDYNKIICDVSNLSKGINAVRKFFVDLPNTIIDRDWKVVGIDRFKNIVDILEEYIKDMNNNKIGSIGTNPSSEENASVEPLPFFLVVYCHLLFARFYQVVTEECLYTYEDLEKYYGVDNNNLRQFHKRAFEVIRDNVAPFILKMRYELGGDNFVYAPIIINYFQDLIRTITMSTKVVNARKAKMEFMADTIISLIKMNARSGIVDENIGETSCPDDALLMEKSDLDTIRDPLERSLKLYDLRSSVTKYVDKHGVKDIAKYIPSILDYLKEPLLFAMKSHTTEKARLEQLDYLAETIITLIKEHSGGMIDNSVLSSILPSVKVKLKENLILHDLRPFISKYGNELDIKDIDKRAHSILNYLKVPILSALASQTNDKERTEDMAILAETIVTLIKGRSNIGTDNSIHSDFLPSVKKFLEDNLNLHDLDHLVVKYGNDLGIKDIEDFTPSILDYLKVPILLSMVSPTNEKEKTEEIDYLAKTISIQLSKLCGERIDSTVLSTILPSVKEQLKEDISKRKKNESPQAGKN